MFKLIPQAYAACPDGAGAGALDLTDCLTLKDGSRVADTYDTLGVVVNVVVRNLFLVAGVILFLMVIYSGFKFISAGSKGKDEAKQIMTTAIAGMIVMLASYWILQIVKTITGIDYLGL